ncbi:hypothetical protein [Cupriavidus basilensis]|uniref:Phage protein n=1 Tax=Cupriavidus basilensis TaxID=68895 RepID=A0A0C4YDJ3_9BURK|nr:hypothetical protein [Cupriavidus basilensis]AJG18816.1 Phage protein [Cupriavidus basilensis]
MYTKSDFDRAVADRIQEYPAVATRFQAGDPTVLASLSAISQMASMLSQQLEIGMMEPFEKVRDSTVLADAALKGIIPVGTPTRVKVLVANPTAADFALIAGRSVLDPTGRPYVVDTPVTVVAGGTGFAQLLQRQTRTIAHTVTGSQPFYTIEVPQPDDGQYIGGIALADAHGNAFTYAQEFTNVGAGDRIFHVESDEYRRIFVKFGYGGVVGYQPAAGEAFTVTVNDTNGNFDLDPGSPFALEYTLAPQDSMVKITLDSVLVPGQNPIDMDTLRELCKYPSTYDASAVYLGEFDFLIRRNMPSLKFLSVWNETIEEQVRGASVDNINRLFVSFQPPDGGDRTTYESDIRALITKADDSYDVAFVMPVVLPIGTTIAATVARVHEPTAVSTQIQDVLLGQYGIDSATAKAGMFYPQYKRVYEQLRANVAALQDGGSDFTVSIGALPSTQLPEQWRYMTADSLTIAVTLSNYNIGYWGR